MNTTKLIAAIMDKEPSSAKVYFPDFKTLWLRLEYKNGNTIDVMKDKPSGTYALQVIKQKPVDPKTGQSKNPDTLANPSITKEEGDALYDLYFSEDVQGQAMDVMALEIMGSNDKVDKAVMKLHKDE